MPRSRKARQSQRRSRRLRALAMRSSFSCPLNCPPVDRSYIRSQCIGSAHRGRAGCTLLLTASNQYLPDLAGQRLEGVGREANFVRWRMELPAAPFQHEGLMGLGIL
jgi:hypothetical protein